MTDEQIISAIIQREGGAAYTHDVAGGDPPTRFGVTQGALAEWRGHPVSEDDVRQMNEQEARDIYRENYLVKPGIAKIANDSLRALLLDAAVNHGPHAAIQMLQRALNLTEDGVIGTHTLAALPLLDARLLSVRFLHERALSYAAICIHDNKKLRYLRGWLNRVFAQVEGVVI